MVYLPAQPGGPDEYADHIHVFQTPGGDMMCLWTQATCESAPDMRVVYSRSTDGGVTWSPIEVLDEPEAPNLCPSLGFPLISRSGRLHCLYNQHYAIGQGMSLFNSVLGAKFPCTVWLMGANEAVQRYGWTFRPGDKVMQIVNDSEKDVFNGEIGRVGKIDREEQLMCVDFDGRIVEYDFGELDEIMLSYAVMIYKSQGSEYP